MSRLRGRQDSDASDLEALQTDVMRFVAILGLCLAAIFSLLHSAAVEHPQVPAPAADGEPHAVAVRAEDPPPATGVLSTSAPDVSAKEASAKAAPARQTPTNETPAEHAPKVELPSEETAAEEMPTKETPMIAAPPEQALPRPAPLEKAQRQPAAEPAASAAGLTLEFESAVSLQALLRAGSVVLYARVGDRFWSADTTGAFSPAAAPGAYYGMAAGTVPPSLRRAFDAGEGDVRWGVTLPTRTASQLGALLARHEQGRLLIDAQANVRHQPATAQP